jgi:hypothetical protein
MDSQFEDDLEMMMAFVNLAVRLRSMVLEEWFTDVWFRNPDTGEVKRVWLLFSLNWRWPRWTDSTMKLPLYTPLHAHIKEKFWHPIDSKSCPMRQSC